MNLRRWILGSIFLAGFLGISFYAGNLLFFAFTPAQTAGSQPARELIIEVHKREGAWELSKLLESQNIIASATSFHRLGRLAGQWQKVKTGEYKVTATQTPLQIFAVITSGLSLARPVTIREGENMYEIADDLEAKQLVPKKTFMALVRDPKIIQSLLPSPHPRDKILSLEGYLFPDTYFFNKTMTPEDMLRQMTKRFHAVWGAAEDVRANELGFTRHQIITLASIIEKETGAVAERPLIGSVFHNRLQKKMKLQSDPTTIYGIWEHFDGNLHKKDLLEYTPYNTYTINSLPPGPISNPGKESILAALFPKKSDYLYFVSHNDGTHEFTSSLEDHNRAVRKFQIDRNARNGKSWRGLNKKQNGS